MISEEPWSALVSKTWDLRNFTTFTFDKLTPGACYLFRLRYRNHLGWSEYSSPSRIYQTTPAAPTSPVPPLSDAIMPHAVHLRWAPPPVSLRCSCDHNGSFLIFRHGAAHGVCDRRHYCATLYPSLITTDFIILIWSAQFLFNYMNGHRTITARRWCLTC